jgi:hypothetical protein
MSSGQFVSYKHYIALLQFQVLIICHYIFQPRSGECLFQLLIVTVNIPLSLIQTHKLTVPEICFIFMITAIALGEKKEFREMQLLPDSTL